MGTSVPDKMMLSWILANLDLTNARARELKQDAPWKVLALTEDSILVLARDTGIQFEVTIKEKK
jgi:hypothetical protein